MKALHGKIGTVISSLHAVCGTLQPPRASSARYYYGMYHTVKLRKRAERPPAAGVMESDFGQFGQFGQSA